MKIPFEQPEPWRKIYYTKLVLPVSEFSAEDIRVLEIVLMSGKILINVLKERK